MSANERALLIALAKASIATCTDQRIRREVLAAIEKLQAEP